MAGSTAGDERDLRFRGIGAEVDDAVLRVESGGRVGLCYGSESGEDKVRWVVDEVFSW